MRYVALAAGFDGTLARDGRCDERCIDALRALGAKPKHDPLPVFAAVLVEDYKKLPPYTTSFFPLAYCASGREIPAEADRKIRALMDQDEDGYLHDHVAATFHAVHYYRLTGQPVPKGEKIVARLLRDQKPDGSWLLNPPSRDRHATFDAVFTLNGVAVTNSGNTISGFADGLSLTIQGAGTSTITVSTDRTSISNALASIVSS